MAVGTKQRWKRDPDRWRIRVDVSRDPATGVRRRLSRVVVAPWTAEAERAVVDVELAKLTLEARLLAGDPDALVGVTVAELADRFLDHRGQRVRHDTKVFYRRYLKVAVAEIGGIEAGKVRPVTLDALYASLLAQGRTPLVVAKVHRSLRAMFSQAVRWQVVGVNAASGAEPPRVPDRPIRPPSPARLAEGLSLLWELDPAMWTFATVGAWTGQRRQLLCGLTWDRVWLDPAAGWMAVTMAVARGAGGVWMLGPTKTGKVHRIALGPATVAALEAHRVWLEKEALTIGVEPGPWIFPLDPSRPAVLPRPDTWSKRWARQRKRVGLDGVVLHDLRRYSTSNLFTGGFDPITIAGRHSHSDPKMTMDRYAEFIPPRDRDAALYLEQLGRPVAGPGADA